MKLNFNIKERTRNAKIKYSENVPQHDTYHVELHQCIGW